VTDADFAEWQRHNVTRQKQPGYAAATITLPLGDLTAEQLRVVSELAVAYGDGTARLTIDQDLILRWIRIDDVEALYARLAAAGLEKGEAGLPTNVTSCPGAESCKLAVTQSRGLGRTLREALVERPDLAEAARGLVVKMSGCPNGCGQHHIAGIGFQGSIRKLGGRAVPQYFVLVGGGPTAEGVTFGRLAAKIPARRAPLALERLIGLYRQDRRHDEAPTAFFQRVGLTEVKEVLADLERLTEETATPEDFIDLGELHAFAPEVMDGECAS
jgi:sulfite reductase beta subunit-like hemoprotein